MNPFATLFARAVDEACRDVARIAASPNDGPVNVITWHDDAPVFDLSRATVTDERTVHAELLEDR